MAIKILREGTEPDQLQRERMRSEARALGTLQGTAAGRHIVEIYNRSSSPDGLFYLVLELVDGKSLADRIKAVGPLPARQAAEMVRTIAEVMDAIHQIGIVHRDLKPSNILLAAGDLPKITDFGLAWFADNQQALTVEGELLGTPEYMPPEQAAGRHTQVDKVSDVYSIGVILYECLTGKPPFRGAEIYETIATILAEDRELVPPETLVRSVPRDLSTICLRCLHWKKGDRYASAGDLAADLDRFLQGRPILARRAGLLERGVKLARRNPWITGLTAMVVAVTAVGFAASWWYAGRAIQQEARANKNAELRFHALENVLTAVTDGRLRLAGQLPLQVELLNDLLPQFEAVVELEGDDPATRNLQGLAWTNLAKIRRDLGKLPAALAAAQSAVAIFRNLVDVAGFQRQANIGLSTALSSEATMLGHAGKLDEAIVALTEAADRLGPLARDDTPALLERLGHIHNNWATCLRFGGKAPSSYPAAENHYEQAVDFFRRGAGALRTCRDWQARTLGNLALFVEDAMQQPTKAIDFGRQAVAIAEALVKDFPKEIDSRECLASSLTNLGGLEMKHGDPTLAIPMLRESLALFEGLAAQVPSNFDFRWNVAMALSDLGQSQTIGPTPNSPEALKLLRRAEMLYKGLTADSPSNAELQRYVEENDKRIKAIEAQEKPTANKPGSGP